jgi:hypothetical protein
MRTLRETRDSTTHVHFARAGIVERASSPLRRCERRSGGAGRVFGDDLVDAAGEWKLVPNRLVHHRAETIVVGCARPNDCCWHLRDHQPPATEGPLTEVTAEACVPGHIQPVLTYKRHSFSEVLRRRGRAASAPCEAERLCCLDIKSPHPWAEGRRFTSAAKASRMSDGPRSYNRCRPSRR